MGKDAGKKSAAAELAGMSTSGFLDFMDRHRTYLNYGEEEIEQDRASTGPPTP